MSNVAKKSILIFIIVAVMVLSLSSVAFAADPHYIYYENEDSEIVRANYKQAVDNLPNDTTLRDALQDAINDALKSAIGDFRNVWVEDQSGPVIDYGEAVDDQLTYPEALDDLQTYGTDKPNHIKVLIIDPDTGQAVEKRWLVSVDDLADIEVDYGTSLADVKDELSTANDLVLTLSDGSESPADQVYWSPADAVYWDEDDPDYILEAGTYSFEGELVMPECAINPDNLKAEVDVIVSDPNYANFTVVEDSESEHPLEGVTIKVEVLIGTVTSVLGTPASWEEVTDEDGKAEFALGDGCYRYTASKEDYDDSDGAFTVEDAITMDIPVKLTPE